MPAMPNFMVPSIPDVWGGIGTPPSETESTGKGKEKETSTWGIKGVKWSSIGKSGSRLLGMGIVRGLPKEEPSSMSSAPIDEGISPATPTTPPANPPETPVKLNVQVSEEDLAEAMAAELDVPKDGERARERARVGVEKKTDNHVGSETTSISESTSASDGNVNELESLSTVNEDERRKSVDEKEAGCVVIEGYCGGDTSTRDTRFEMRVFKVRPFVSALWDQSR